MQSPPTQIRLSYAADGVCPLAHTPGVTFRIDPDAADQSIAIENGHTVWQVSWAPSFRGGTADDPVVRDVHGVVVVRDGTEIRTPPNGHLTLHGPLVCVGEGQLLVLDVARP